jgi:hypothetical protein
MKSGMNKSMDQVIISQEEVDGMGGGTSLKILFSIENQSFDLISMMHFGIIELLFKINTDICDSYKMDVESDQCAHLTLVLKHILKDLGVPQMYANVIIRREDRENLIVLTITHSDESNDGINGDKSNDGINDYEQIPLKTVVIRFDTTNPHKIEICIVVFYNEGDEGFSSSSSGLCDVSSKNMQNFVDKMLKTLIKNIINRLKQFIEKMPYTSSNSNTNKHIHAT